MKSTRGVTLIEVMVALAVLVIVGTIVYGLYTKKAAPGDTGAVTADAGVLDAGSP